jgi:hypothetical protein
MRIEGGQNVGVRQFQPSLPKFIPVLARKANRFHDTANDVRREQFVKWSGGNVVPNASRHGVAMFPGELQEISPLKLGHEIKLVGIQVPEVDLGSGRGGSRSIFLIVGRLLTTNGEGIGIAVAGTHFVGLNKSLSEALMKSLFDNQTE